MKKIMLIFAAGILAASAATAQVSVQFNIGLQPIWGPTGYDYVNYYYLPDIDAYYDVPNQQYVYMEGNAWVTRPSLPPRYASYDLYHAHKVVINDARPWMNDGRYRTQYARYKGKHDQVAIRDSHDEKYFENPRHPEHAKWHGNPHDDRGHGNPHGDRHDNGRH